MVNNPKGHNRKSAVHERAMAHGAHVERYKELDAETTLIEYGNSKGCYAYFKSIPGSYHIQLDFDAMTELWPKEEAELPIKRVSKVSF